MPARVVICPVVWSDEHGLCPKFLTFTDPGHPDGGGYVHASIYSPGRTNPPAADERCLSIVGGFDMTPIDADGDILSLYDMADVMLPGLHAELEKTPAEVGMNQGKVNSTKARIRNHGGDDSGLGMDTPLYEFANRIAAILSPGEDIRGNRTHGKTGV